ncbi:MAG: hypothetical protein IPO25_18930 [Saprospiraceae bacterium]|nr:hypothetical protein [Saprospiraceae bacterium]
MDLGSVERSRTMPGSMMTRSAKYPWLIFPSSSLYPYGLHSMKSFSIAFLVENLKHFDIMIGAPWEKLPVLEDGGLPTITTDIGLGPL